MHWRAGADAPVRANRECRHGCDDRRSLSFMLQLSELYSLMRNRFEGSQACEPLSFDRIYAWWIATSARCKGGFLRLGPANLAAIRMRQSGAKVAAPSASPPSGQILPPKQHCYIRAFPHLRLPTSRAPSYPPYISRIPTVPGRVSELLH